MKVLITPKSFQQYKDAAYPLLEEQGYEIIANETGRTLSEDEIIALAGEDVVGIIVGIDPLSARVLENCKRLKAISKYGVGLDNIDLDAAKRLGIRIDSARESNNVSVAELAIALMFEAARKISQHSANVKAGGWQRILGMELAGKTMGVIGGGKIGREVAKRGKGLFMNVILYDPYVKDPDFLQRYDIAQCDRFEAVLASSDIVTLHLPLTDATRHLINSDTLKLMKPNAILINTSRGELVDEESLYEALSSGQIAFAAQDVFSKEPPDPNEKLLKLDNFVLTPHAGAYTAEAIEKMAMQSTRNLIRMLQES